MNQITYYESMLFDFIKDKNKREDSLEVCGKVIKLIQQLALQKAKIELTLLSSLFCLICQQDITKDQFKMKQTLKSNCNCNRHYHKKCLQLQVEATRNEFNDLQSFLYVLNDKYRCNNKCEKNCFQENSIIEATDQDYYNIMLNDFHYSKQEKDNKEKQNELEEQKNGEFSCQICTEEIDFKTKGLKLKCGHSQICIDCLQENFIQQLKNNDRLEIKDLICPQDKCESPKIQFNDIEKIFYNKKEVIEKLEYKSIKTEYDRMVRENPEIQEQLVVCPGLYFKEEGDSKLIYVPQQNITKYRKTEKIEDLKGKENQKIEMCEYTFIQDRSDQTKIRHKCLKCKYQFCLNKCDDIHEGQSCQQYLQYQMDNNQDRRQELLALGYKFCPNCDIISVKVDGCNKVQCTNCQMFYCYVCLFLADTAQKVYTHLTAVHGGYR